MRVLYVSLVTALFLATACAPAAPPNPTAAPAKPVSTTTPAKAGPTTAPAAKPAAAAQPAAPAKPQQAGWEAEWQKVLSAAKQEGKVVVMGPPGDLIRKNITEGFKKAYPEITLEWNAGRGNEQVAKVEAERRAGLYNFDVYMGGTGSANKGLKKMGALDPITSMPLLPEVTDPKLWRNGGLEFADQDRQLNMVFGISTTELLIYDPKFVKAEEVDSPEKLLDPKWKGKIVVNDPTTLSGSGWSLFHFLWANLGHEKAAPLFRGLKEQAAAVDRDQRRQVEWIARGRYPIGLSPSGGVLEQMMEQGLKVEVVSDFKGVGGISTASFASLGLLNKAPHPNAARVFINWVLTKEGQTAYSTAMNQASLRVDVPTDHLPAHAFPKPGVKYWPTYDPKNLVVPKDLEALLKDVFSS